MTNGASDTPALTEGPRKVTYLALVPVALALVMAAPSVWGGFLTGDDIQLIRDHVLVNHPSFAHLIKLFSVPHRDLYQPIPLATFAANFAVIRWLGLVPAAQGPAAGAWVFHVTNVLIHAVNAALVWWLIRRVTGRGWPALIAGAFFAVHPLNVECVAWLNGRMIMLSTTFTLGALIAATRVFERGGAGHVLLTVLMAVLAMMSKVSVGLPVLMLLIPFVRRCWPSGRWWVTFALVTAVTGFFVLLNYSFSRDQFDSAEQVLQGSRWVRTVIALGWYVGRYVVPVGLAPWHPTETLITTSHPEFVPALAAVVVLLVVSAVLLRYSRWGAAGVIWFFATLAVTLPLVPSRNLLVAERYVYLPAIGFHGIIAAGCVYVVTALRRPTGRKAGRTRGGAKAGLAVVVGVWVVTSAILVGVSWKTTGYYRNNVARCLRTAELYPNHGGVWTRLAWAHYDAGEYEQAVESAAVELERHPNESESDVWQVQGMALLRSGKVDEAQGKLQAAVEADPANGMARVRLATALVEAGLLSDAVPHYRQAVETMPGYNPGIIGLAQTYQKLGRMEEAAEMFAQALRNNPYDPLAATSLAQIELTGGKVQAATARLEELLRWMPENAVAHANLGVCYSRSGRVEDAIGAYRAALALEPTLVPPRLSLALLLAQTGAPKEADSHFRLAAEQTEYATLTVLLPYSDFLIAQSDYRGAAAIWAKGLRSKPGDQAMTSWYGWVCVLAERWGPARQARASLTQPSAPGTEYATHVAANLMGIVLDVHANQPEGAAAAVSKLCADDSSAGRAARDRLQRALKAYSERHPKNPWPYYLMIGLFKADGQSDGARLALEAFEQFNADADWTRRARALLDDPSSQPAGDRLNSKRGATPGVPGPVKDGRRQDQADDE